MFSVHYSAFAGGVQTVSLPFVAWSPNIDALEKTDAVTLTFILLMARNRPALRRAQEEIDAVIGNDRLPDLMDRSKLPYIECILKEVYRYVFYSPTKGSF